VAAPGANQARVEPTPAASQASPIVPPPVAAASGAGEREADLGTGGVALGGPIGRVPLGLVASVVVHLALVGLVAAAFFSGHEPAPAAAIPVELVPDDTTQPEKPPEDAPSKPDKPTEPASKPTPDKPADAKAAPDAPAEPTPPPPADTGEAIEPVDIIPPLASMGPGMADSSRDTTVTEDEIGDVRAQVRRCWEIPSGWSEARQVTVTIRFHLNPDGTVRGKPVVVQFPASRLGKTAADNAIRGVAKCAPYKLPPGKSEQFSDVQLSLTPNP
jgi:hypothetical protein